jgi:hypothetical protein
MSKRNARRELYPGVLKMAGMPQDQIEAFIKETGHTHRLATRVLPRPPNQQPPLIGQPDFQLLDGCRSGIN